MHGPDRRITPPSTESTRQRCPAAAAQSGLSREGSNHIRSHHSARPGACQNHFADLFPRGELARHPPSLYNLSCTSGPCLKEPTMNIPLKLNAIDQEHLQELYNAAGVARDELPYTEQFEQLCQG